MDSLHIEFNNTMGTITVYHDDRCDLEVIPLNYRADLGNIIQDYYNEYRKEK